MPAREVSFWAAHLLTLQGKPFANNVIPPLQGEVVQISVDA